MFICACGCGTHVYSTRTGPGHRLRTPYRAGCTARVNTGAFATFRVCTCRTVFGLDSASRSVSCMCMCVCAAVGMCSLTCTLCTAFRMSTRANVPSLPYPLRSSLGYHGRCAYLPVLVLVLVPLLYSASLGQPGQCIICPCSCVNRCTVCTVLVSLVQCFAWSARAMYLLAFVRTRTRISCAVLRLNSTGIVPTCPYRSRTGTSRAVLRLDSTGSVPMRPCLYPCTVFCYG